MSGSSREKQKFMFSKDLSLIVYSDVGYSYVSSEKDVFSDWRFFYFDGPLNSLPGNR